MMDLERSIARIIDAWHVDVRMHVRMVLPNAQSTMKKLILSETRMADPETSRSDATQAATFCYRYFSSTFERRHQSHSDVIAMFNAIANDPALARSLIVSMREFGDVNNMHDFSPQSLTEWIDEGYVQPRYLDIITALRDAVTIDDDQEEPPEFVPDAEPEPEPCN